MTQLVKQPSRFPTRKIMAVILSGMIIGVCQSLLRIFWPDHPFAPYVDDIDVWLQGLIMVIAGYVTKEREHNVESTTTSEGDLPESGRSVVSCSGNSELRSVEETTGEDGNASEDLATGSG